MAIGFKTHSSERAKLTKAFHSATGSSLSGFETQADFKILSEGMAINVEELKAAATKEVEEWKAAEVAKKTIELDEAKKELDTQLAEIKKKKGALDTLFDTLDS